MAMLRPASEMKDSGIEWVGQIPSNWKVVKNNRLFRITKSLVNDAWETTQLLSLTKGGIIEKNINDGGGKQLNHFQHINSLRRMISFFVCSILMFPQFSPIEVHLMA